LVASIVRSYSKSVVFLTPRMMAQAPAASANQPGVDARLDALIAAVDVVDEPLAVLDRQQPLLGGVVADADDHAVEQVQRFVDQSRMAAREGVERPGEDCSAFHIGQR
jgi:PHD/YefM family antitoxin component YafN of YafNO toxin-antitoxin module